MATSGTTNFSVTRDDVVKACLRVLGVIGVGETPITEDYTNCSEALNIMIKSWAKKGFPLWVYDQVTIPMLIGLNKYPIGTTAGYVYSTSILTGGTGYPASGVVTFTGGTTGTVATGTYTAVAGVIKTITITNPGTSYTTAPTVSFVGAGTGATATATIAGVTTDRPLRIMSAFLRSPENYDTDLLEMSRQEYDVLGNKFIDSTPNQFYYDVELNNGQLYISGKPTIVGYKVLALCQRQFEDVNLSTETFDFPQEWFQALKWGLCAELAEEYGVDENKISRLQIKADAYILECFDWAQEEASIYFTQDYRGTYTR